MSTKRSASNQEQEENSAKKVKKVKPVTFEAALTVFRNGTIEEHLPHFLELIDLGSLQDINMRNKEGETLLMTQCMNGCLLAVKVLLDSGADANLTDNMRNSAIALTSRYLYKHSKNLVIIKLLVEHGADVNQKINLPALSYLTERTAVFEACARGWASTARLLFELGATLDNVDQALRIACEKNYIQVITLLLERGASVDTIDRQGRTPLLLLIDKGDAGYWINKIISLLEQYGADVNATDSRGESALLYAIKRKNVAAHLLSVVADMFSADGMTNTVSDLPFIRKHNYLVCLIRQHRFTTRRANRDIVPILK